VKLIDAIGCPIVCPDCGADARAEGAKPRGKVVVKPGTNDTPPVWAWPEHDPHWAVVNCLRCGKKLHQAGTEVKPGLPETPMVRTPVQADPRTESHEPVKAVKHGR
jgi:hypothetical protein